ncbi:MAG: PilZ domain-containing protein [Spirochaetaceae bacterium]|jgi:hypothetical protein|nr:PilZ domain-containing protein [Spirochaetaceae bacterium]
MNTYALLLLQGLSDFQIQPKPIQGIIFLAGTAVIVLVVVFLNKSKKVKNSAVFKSGTVKKPELILSENKDLKKATNAYGLGPDERKFLDGVFSKMAMDPAAVFDSMRSIDEGFSQAVRALSRDEDADADTAKLFAIRNKIEYYLMAAEAAKDSSKVKRAVRRSRRAETNLPVDFQLVVEKEEQAGLKKVRKLSLDGAKHAGRILDISSGGCALGTGEPGKTGTRFKIEFKIGKKTSVSALVRVVGVNKNRDGNVLHSRFLKISARSLNAVNAFVYGYSDI